MINVSACFPSLSSSEVKPKKRSGANNQHDISKQPRSQDLFPGFGAGWEKALASAGHVLTLHPEILGVIL